VTVIFTFNSKSSCYREKNEVEKHNLEIVVVGFRNSIKCWSAG